jgi:hypothetical protein
VLIFIVWMQVLVLKLFLWHDITFIGGLIAGGLLAAVWLSLHRSGFQLKNINDSV